MAQIAQQDHLYVEIADMSNPTNDELALLAEKFKAGTILDVVLKSVISSELGSGVGYLRITGATVAETEGTRIYSFSVPGFDETYVYTETIE